MVHKFLIWNCICNDPSSMDFIGIYRNEISRSGKESQSRYINLDMVILYMLNATIVVLWSYMMLCRSEHTYSVDTEQRKVFQRLYYKTIVQHSSGGRCPIHSNNFYWSWWFLEKESGHTRIKAFLRYHFEKLGTERSIKKCDSDFVRRKLKLQGLIIRSVAQRTIRKYALLPERN